MEICSEPTCERPRAARGLCATCYTRKQRAGTLPAQYNPGGRGYGRGKPMQRSVCAFEYCDRIADIPTSGLCRAHYSQQWRGQELRPLKGSQRTAEYWLTLNRIVDPQTDCWLWTRNRDTSGYGQYNMDGKMHRVHRIAYELWVGPIEGDTIHHKCTVRHCFNPEHLERATRRDNSLEMHERLAYRRRIKRLEQRIAELEAQLH